MIPEEDKYTGDLSVARRMAVMFLYGGLVFAAAVGLFLYYGSDRGNIADIEPASGQSLVPEQVQDNGSQYTQ